MADLQNITYGAITYQIPGAITVDDAMSGTSENPVQNKVISGALEDKVDKVDGKGLSTNDYTDAEKQKLAGLENYDDTTLAGRVGAVETLLDGHPVGVDVPANAVFTDTVYDDTALAARVSANESAIATLNGTGEGSVSKQIGDAIDAVVDGAPAAFDTLKEIADWIANDETGTAALIARVAALEALVADYADTRLQMTDGTNTVDKFILAKDVPAQP